MKEEYQEVILIGDTGEPELKETDHVFHALKSSLPKGENNFLIFLGDNIYPVGMPAEGHPNRKTAELKLQKTFEIFKDYKGKVIFLSGNHDWNKGRIDGLEYVLRQEEYIKKSTGREDIFLPAGGCPGPHYIDAGNHLGIIIINTQWWMHKGTRPIGKAFGCKAESEDDFFIKLEDYIKLNKHKRILVAGHLPVESYGMHGGKYELKHHIFPLTIYYKRGYIPLPFLGSALPAYRKYIGAKEDMAYPRYRRFIKKLREIFERYPGIIYASGHEHNLQLIKKHQVNYVVSGGGSRTKYVVKGRNAIYAKPANGFAKLRFYENGKTEIEFIEVSKRDGSVNLGYKGII